MPAGWSESGAPSRPYGEPEPVGALRRLLLALVVLGAAGLAAELLLLEHYETPWQWVPLVVLAATLAGGVATALRPSYAVVRFFRLVMAAAVVAGLLGLAVHLWGNVEFELESDPSLQGFRLLWRALGGATPSLAPGALAQLGLLGLVFTFRHPALWRPARGPIPDRGAALPHKENG